MELRFNAILCYKFSYEDSNAGHIKFSCGLYLACGPQFPYPCLNQIKKIFEFRSERD